MNKTLKKLIRLLQQIVDDAGYALVSRTGDDTRLFCIRQYNNVYGRLLELDASLAEPFGPLSENVSVGVVRLTARDMAWSLSEELRKRRYGAIWECIFAPLICTAAEFDEARC